MITQEPGIAGSIPRPTGRGIGYLPQDRHPWPDETFSLPTGPLPESPNPQHGSAERAAEIVWRRLDRCLDDPIRVEHTPHRSRIWILDVVYYEVDRDLRLVRGGVVQPTGELLLTRDLDLLSLEEDRRWFESLSDRVFSGWPPQERFHGMTPNFMVRGRQKVMSLLWKKVVGDHRFQSAARVVFHELGLDMDIWRLACEASISWRGLTAEEYQLVWRNLPAFRQVAAESPALLQLLPIYLSCHDDRFQSDPMREIKSWFRSRGLSEAGWRYLVRGGMHYYVPVLRRMRPAEQLVGLLRFLKIVEEMQFDTNLFDVVTEKWINVISSDHQWLSLRQNWREVHPSVLRVAYGASRDIGAWIAEERAKELPGVLRWAKEEGIALDRSQVRAGWDALARRWRRARPEKAEGAVLCSFEWEAPTGLVEFGELYAAPLCSAAELKAEGVAMENCLGSQHFVDACKARRMIIYSIRRTGTDESVAVASFIRNGAKKWTLKESKGRLNSAPEKAASRVTRELEGQLRMKNACCGKPMVNAN